MPAIAREPLAITRSACAASGRTRSASSARSNWRSSSGLPAVVVWHAARNSGAGSPRRRRTSSAVPSRVSGPGRTTAVDGSRRTSASRSSFLVPLAGPQGRQQQQREPVEPAGQVHDEPQRGGVAPLQVVDRRAPAAARRRGRRSASRGRAARRTSPRPARPARRTPRARSPPPRSAAGRAGRVDEHGFEQLPYGTEAEGLFELAAAGAEHGQVLLGGQPAGLGEQPGLADARPAPR